MLKPTAIFLLFHIFLASTIHAYSENYVYHQPSGGKREHLLLNLRSGNNAQRSTRRIFAQMPIRFGGRSDIPALVGKETDEDEAILEEKMDRDQRAFSRTNGHLRFGRGHSNFLRYGRTGDDDNDRRDYNRLTRAKNSLFMRFGRGKSDFIRFGRSEGVDRKKRDIIDEEKRGNNHFMRYGRRYDAEEFEEDDGEGKLEDALFLRLLSQIGCNIDEEKCDLLH